ncbi:cytochrome P450 [Penicillium longicatenatum]|nr:cytochrome P450 [Penicillium longicatenatum]
MYETKNPDWTEVPIERHLRMLVARMTAKVFMGNPTCRDPEWLKISIDFAVDLFITASTIKMFPSWMYGLVARFIPARYRTFRQLKIGRRIVGDLTQKHKIAKEKRQRGEEAEEEDTLLNWMLDHGTPDEVDVHEMGARQCILTLASIHTTASNMSNMLYDLSTYPEWFVILREEVLEIAKELGPPGQIPNISAKEWCTRLDKLDSFFVESQRHNPVLLLNPQRLAYEDIKLEDGTVVPSGSQIAFANYEHSMDPDVYPNPLDFDPMRSYRKRMSAPSQLDLHKAGMTHPKNLAFGYGNQACAGRQVAVAEIKFTMARLLHEFEFKFPPGRIRPKTQHFNETCITDQSMTLMMRKIQV